MSTAALLEYRNLVGGELVDAVEGGTRKIVNPANGSPAPRPTALELGKAPAVVLDDADPARVAAGLRIASFCNSGQESFDSRFPRVGRLERVEFVFLPVPKQRLVSRGTPLRPLRTGSPTVVP